MIWVFFVVGFVLMVAAIGVAVWRMRQGQRILVAPKGFAFFGPVLVLIGLVLGWGGIAPLTESRDADGYYMSDAVAVDRPSHAVVTRDTDLLRGRWDTLSEESFITIFMAEPDDIRMHADTSAPDALFLGIAATTDVDAYLDGVAHDEITEWEADQARITDLEYTSHDGTAAPDPPGAEPFWTTSVSGTGPQTLDWTIESGDWTAVVMNADASIRVTAELAFGTSPPAGFVTLSWVSLSVGLALVLVGGFMIVSALRSRRQGSTSPPATPPVASTPPEPHQGPAPPPTAG